MEPLHSYISKSFVMLREISRELDVPILQSSTAKQNVDALARLPGNAHGARAGDAVRVPRGRAVAVVVSQLRVVCCCSSAGQSRYYDVSRRKPRDLPAAISICLAGGRRHMKPRASGRPAASRASREGARQPRCAISPRRLASSLTCCRASELQVLLARCG